jgi:hypothetical protein
MSKIGYNSRRRVEKEMMISLSSRSNNACQLLVGKCTLHLNISSSCHELCRDHQTQAREFVSQSASKVELNNLSHIPYAHSLHTSHLFVVVAQEIQHSNTGFHDLSFVLDFT